MPSPRWRRCRAAGVTRAGGRARRSRSSPAPGAASRTHGRTRGGALVYDDYAHHPTEVRATLEAARTLEPRRLVAAFQPHLYSRTQMLAREFGRALALADLVVVLDVYRGARARRGLPGRERLAGRARRRPTRPRAPGLVAARARTTPSAVCASELSEGDLLLTLGAGRRRRAGAEARGVSDSGRRRAPTTRWPASPRSGRAVTGTSSRGPIRAEAPRRAAGLGGTRRASR